MSWPKLLTCPNESTFLLASACRATGHVPKHAPLRDGESVSIDAVDDYGPLQRSGRVAQGSVVKDAGSCLVV